MSMRLAVLKHDGQPLQQRAEPLVNATRQGGTYRKWPDTGSRKAKVETTTQVHFGLRAERKTL